MKYLSIAIPCYNSQEYMDKAIESCLILKDDVEIIIVDDGSSDLTAKKVMTGQLYIQIQLNVCIKKMVDMDRLLIRG